MGRRSGWAKRSGRRGGRDRQGRRTWGSPYARGWCAGGARRGRALSHYEATDSALGIGTEADGAGFESQDGARGALRPAKDRTRIPTSNLLLHRDCRFQLARMCARGWEGVLSRACTSPAFRRRPEALLPAGQLHHSRGASSRAHASRGRHYGHQQSAIATLPSARLGTKPSRRLSRSVGCTVTRPCSSVSVSPLSMASARPCTASAACGMIR